MRYTLQILNNLRFMVSDPVFVYIACEIGHVHSFSSITQKRSICYSLVYIYFIFSFDIPESNYAYFAFNKIIFLYYVLISIKTGPNYVYAQ